jgi:thiol-disulfide isomerase/thioredoxin
LQAHAAVKEKSMMTNRLPHSLQTLAALACFTLLAGSGGCGSKSEETQVVTPPAINEGQASNSTTSDSPPGELELPPGEIPAPDPPQETTGGGLELPEGPITPPETDSAKVQYAEWEEIEKVATSSGRVTVVDVWSTVCAPCLKEFPGLVKLHQQHGDAIQCISVDVDFDGRKSRPPESYEEKIVGFLSSVGATFPNYISRTPSDDVLDALDVVSIPTVLIYDAQGKLVKQFVDADETAGFSYEKDIIPFVTKLAG